MSGFYLFAVLAGAAELDLIAASFLTSSSQISVRGAGHSIVMISSLGRGASDFEEVVVGICLRRGRRAISLILE